MPQSIRIAAVADIPSGTGKEFVVGDRLLAVFNVNGVFHVLDGICPHAGGPLAEGALQGTIITCPWHGWQFDVTTGRHCLTSHIRQTTYACLIENGDVFVELPDGE